MGRDLRKLSLGLLVVPLVLVSVPFWGNDEELWRGVCFLYHEVWADGGTTKIETWVGTGFFVAPDLVLTAAHLHPEGTYDVKFGYDDDDVVFLTLKPYGSDKSYKTEVVIKGPDEHDLMLLRVYGYRSPKFFELTTKIKEGEKIVVLAGRMIRSQFDEKEVFSPQKLTGFVVVTNYEDFWGVKEPTITRLISFTPTVWGGASGSPLLNSKGKVIGVVVGRTTPTLAVAEPVYPIIPYLPKTQRSSR